MAMFDDGLLDYDKVDLLRMAAENEDVEALIRLEPWFGEDDYLAAAYAAQCEAGEDSESKAIALEIAGRKSQRSWSIQSTSGLLADWASRSKGEYEQACVSHGAPIWAAMAAPEISDLERPAAAWLSGKACSSLKKPYWAQHDGTAVGLASETLLWNGPEFDYWLDAMASGPALAQGRESLLAMRDSHEMAKELLHPAAIAMGKARKSNSSKSVESIAKLFVHSDAGRWLPFVVAWGEHAGFKEADKQCLGPLLNACLIDELNAGFVAANWTYGSFNARMALIVVELDKRGLVSDGAIEILAARWRDLRSSATMSAYIGRSAFKDDIVSCGEYMEARSQTLALSREIPPSLASSKSPSL
jgi:hypothetical protein